MTAIPLAPGLTLPFAQLSRHVGVFGATGTGKTTSAAALIDRAPCPVLVLDAKGDLEASGDSVSLPALRVDALGPDLMTRALELSEAQSGALQVAFAWAEDTGRPLVTLQDLRALLDDTAAARPSGYGLVTPASVAAVQRACLRLERAAPWVFRDGAPDYRDTRGVHVIACQHIAHVPGLYGALAAHIMDSLYRGLGELGDVPPGLLVMIDESHLVFQDAPIGITRRIEQVTRLIRSRGVGLIYVTQSPADLPDSIMGQLATRIQHGLRGATRKQVAEIKAAADSVQVAPVAITGLGVGEAIVMLPGQSGKRVRMARSARPTGSVGLTLPVQVAVRATAPVARAVEPVEPEPAPVAVAVEKPLPWWIFALGALLVSILF